MKTIGVDAGSVSVKTVVIDDRGEVTQRIYRRHKGHPVAVALDVLKEIGSGAGCLTAVTGSAGKLIA